MRVVPVGSKTLAQKAPVCPEKSDSAKRVISDDKKRTKRLNEKRGEMKIPFISLLYLSNLLALGYRNGQGERLEGGRDGDMGCLVNSPPILIYLCMTALVSSNQGWL